MPVLFSKAEFWPKALFIVRTAFSSRMKQDAYASLSLCDSETIFTVFTSVVYSFKFFSFLTYASIDHNFSNKKACIFNEHFLQ